jgi:hypothetical protein
MALLNFILMNLNQESFDLEFYLREFNQGLPLNQVQHFPNDLNRQFIDEIFYKEQYGEIPY